MKESTRLTSRHQCPVGRFMGVTVIVAATILAAVTCSAQGYVFFENVEPIYDVDGKTPLGPGFWVQLYAAPIGSTSLAPMGSPVQFVGDGYFFENQPVTFPGVPPFGMVVGQAKAWRGLDGSSFEAADHVGGHVGLSEIFSITLGNLNFGPPFMTLNLKSFSLYVVPEPPVAALTALGVVAFGLLSLRGRHRRRARRQ